MNHRHTPSTRVELGMPAPSSSPRSSSLLPSAALQNAEKGMAGSTQSEGPKIFGLPLKYVSLITLAVQNASLSIVMHYSRISTPPALAYSPASAVLLNELLKGTISFLIAMSRTPQISESSYQRRLSPARWLASLPYLLPSAFWQVCREVFSSDCWKLSIPALLYVIQNSLQFVAISNLPVATFQVTYQMKILTTAAFSVALLRKKLSSTKWLSLFFLAIGVGIVQIQTAGTSTKHHSHSSNGVVGSAHEYQHVHVMSPMKGFGAVTAACFTSGLAGVYFEMVLKNSRADLWVRNVQLSLFSLIPALLPILYETKDYPSQGFFTDLLRNFGGWAWATVAVQVFGGLITAVVIKYSDNILKGFATSLSIILSFMASVWLFEFRMTLSFVIGASTVLSATWMYNQPPGKEPVITFPSSLTNKDSSIGKLMSPTEPILGEFSSKKSSPFGTPKGIASALGINNNSTTEVNGHLAVNGNGFGEMQDTSRYQHAPYGSPYGSRVPSTVPSRSQTPHPPHSNGPSRSGSSVNLVPLVPMEREASR